MEPSEVDNELTGVILDAAIETHKHLGPAFGESVYENALFEELSRRGVSFARQVPIVVQYRGVAVGNGAMDLVVERRVVVELKAQPTLAPVHTAQAISYLKATGLRLGVAINFGERHIKGGFKRIVQS